MASTEGENFAFSLTISMLAPDQSHQNEFQHREKMAISDLLRCA